MIISGNGTAWHWKDGQWDSRGDILDTDDDNPWFMVAAETASRAVLVALGGNVNTAWLSEDTGRTWQTRGIEHVYGDQSFGFTDLKWNAAQQRIWAVAGTGACYLEADQLAASEEPLRFKPADFGLLAAYPNPFNANVGSSSTWSSRVWFNCHSTGLKVGWFAKSCKRKWNSAGTRLPSMEAIWQVARICCSSRIPAGRERRG